MEEVRDGIAHHSGESKTIKLIPGDVVDNEKMPSTYEGCIVRLADKVAYLGRDIEDAIFAEIIDEECLPGELKAKIGLKNGEIVDYFVKDIVSSSSEECITLSDEASDLMKKMSDFNYRNIYLPEDKLYYDMNAQKLITVLWNNLFEFVGEYQDNFTAYKENQNQVVTIIGSFIQSRSSLYFLEEKALSRKELASRIVTDFISCLTDRFAADAFSVFFLPRPDQFRFAW
jgi:dGTPase